MEQGQIIALVLGGGFTAALVSGVIQLVLWKWNRKAQKDDKESDHDKCIKRAVCVILYDRIKYLGRHHISEGYITTDDLEDIMIMHKCYHDDLDGNGFLDSLMAQVRALPIRKK